MINYLLKFILVNLNTLEKRNLICYLSLVPFTYRYQYNGTIGGKGEHFFQYSVHYLQILVFCNFLASISLNFKV